jgi:hypothetical protein
MTTPFSATIQDIKDHPHHVPCAARFELSKTAPYQDAIFLLLLYINNVFIKQHGPLYRSMTLHFKHAASDTIECAFHADADIHEALQRTLKIYANILLKLSPLTALHEQGADLMALKQMLDLSALHIKIAFDAQQPTEALHAMDISTLQGEIHTVHQHVGIVLQHL